jgi:predicted transcriptional regulator
MRNNYPETSKEAYRSLDPNQLNQTYRDILKALKQLTEATYEEIAVHLNENPSKIWKRLSELNKAELIYRPGTKRLLKSGRNGFTWKLKTDDNEQDRPFKPIEGKAVVDFSKTIQGIQQNLF